MMPLPESIEYKIPTLSEIDSNVVDWDIDINSTAILIHDMQKYFVKPFDKTKDPIKTVISNIKSLLVAARKANIPVFYTAQPGDQHPNDRALLIDFWGKGLSADPSQTAIIEEISPEIGDLVLDKWRYSAFKKSVFQKILLEKNCNQLIIAGVYGHIGCLSTALEAFMLDIKPFIPIDAVADFSVEDHKMAGSYIAKRCGFITTSEKLITALNSKENLPKSMADLKKILSDCLNIPTCEITDEVYLSDLGLDSIWLMKLAEKWKGVGITYLDLVQTLTPQELLNLILKKSQTVPA